MCRDGRRERREPEKGRERMAMDEERQIEAKRRTRVRRALLALALFALAVGISFLWEGPRTVYTHAVIICLDCIGLI